MCFLGETSFLLFPFYSLFRSIFFLTTGMTVVQCMALDESPFKLGVAFDSWIVPLGPVASDMAKRIDLTKLLFINNETFQGRRNLGVMRAFETEGNVQTIKVHNSKLSPRSLSLLTFLFCEARPSLLSVRPSNDDPRVIRPHPVSVAGHGGCSRGVCPRRWRWASACWKAVQS